MKMVSYLSFDSPASLPLLLSVLTYLSMLRSSSVARLASEPKSCASRFNKLKSVWFLLSRQTHLRSLIRFELLSFFQKLSRNSPLIVLPIRWLFQMLANFPLCFVAFGRSGTHVRKYIPFRSSSASRLSKNLLRIKFIWLNFYTMKFSRFRFSKLLNVIILTQSVNIVKCFFPFSHLF